MHPTPQSSTTPRYTARPCTSLGETYAGALINPDGAGHHIIILLQVLPPLEWRASMDRAAELGGALPTRAEAAHIYSVSGQFSPAREFKGMWHWTCAQLADWVDNAWAQNFGSGNQCNWRKRDAFPALVLRRIPIQLFADSINAPHRASASTKKNPQRISERAQ